MTSFLLEVQSLLGERSGLRLSAPQIASRLFCSESTLRRKLRSEGTSFVRERNAARARAAFELFERGYPVEQVARRVGITPDHLRLVMESVYGRSPETIKLAIDLSERLKGEPESRRELTRAKHNDQLLQELLNDIGPSDPLYDWARNLVLLGHHPEREAPEYREKLRQKERAAHIRRQQQREAEAVIAMPFDELDRLDVEELLAQKEYRREHMRWRANQRRRRERSGGVSK